VRIQSPASDTNVSFEEEANRLICHFFCVWFIIRARNAEKEWRVAVVNIIPSKIFLTKGVGVHKDKLASFEMALRKAGIEKFNLVSVSSIMPPKCRTISKKAGLGSLKPGQIVFCVMARNETSEPGRLISAAVGVAAPKDRQHYGYLSEHHAYGEGEKVSGDYAEDLAATMLATTLGIPFDVDKAWDERKQVYRASGNIFKTNNICQAAKGDKNGCWVTVIALAVFVT
jgi:arginine decarboxylase